MEEVMVLGEDKLSRQEPPVKNLILEFILNQRSMETKKAYYRDICFFINMMRVEQGSSLSWWSSLESSHLVLFRNICEQKNESPRTIQRRLSTLNSFCEFLVLKNILMKNPCKSVKRPYVSRVVVTPDFSNEEVRAILGSISNHNILGALHLAILTTLFYTGLRQGELCNLKIKNLIKINGDFNLHFTGKGGKERIVPLSNKPVEALALYLKMRKVFRGDFEVDDYLFISMRKIQDGKNDKLNESALRYILRSYCKKVGIKHPYSVHSTRATFIGASLEKEIPLYQVSILAGHKDEALTSSYSKRRNVSNLGERIEKIYD